MASKTFEIYKMTLYKDACAIGWVSLLKSKKNRMKQKLNSVKALFVTFVAIEFKVIAEKGGRHQWNITYHEYSQQLKVTTPCRLNTQMGWLLMPCQYSNYLDIIYAPSICLIKLSILGLVTRLFCPAGRSEWFWWVIQILNILNTLFYIAHFGIPLFVCSPRQKIWDPQGYPDGKCLDVFKLYIASAATNVGSDMATFFVPLWRIWTLRISRRRRAGVSACFAAGGLAVVSSIVRLVWGFRLAKTQDFSYVKVCKSRVLSDVSVKIGVC